MKNENQQPGAGRNDPYIKQTLDSIAARDDLTFDQQLALISALSPKQEPEDPQVAVARINALSKGHTWLKEGVITAVVAAIASIATGYFAGFFKYQENVATALSQLKIVQEQQEGETRRASSANDANLRSIELNQRAAILERLLVINPLELGDVETGNLRARADAERRARICLLATFGIIEIPEAVLGVERAKLGDYATASNDMLKARYRCDTKTALPVSLPVSRPEPTVETKSRFQLSDLEFDSTNPRTEFNFSVSDSFLLDGDRRVPFLPSPNGGEFRDLADRRYIVVTNIAISSALGAATLFSQSAKRASTHIVIGRSGEVLQTRRFDQYAWHAGASRIDGLEHLNLYSFAIALVNWGRLQTGKNYTGRSIPSDEIVDLADGTQWHKYTEVQIKTLKAVLASLVEAYPTVEKIVSKTEISKRGRGGPGPLIDVPALSSELIKP